MLFKRGRMSLKIIYLDDEPDLCEMFIDNLKSDTRQIWAFTDPEEFIRKVNEIRPDLVFIDYRLPYTNGDIVASRLKLDLPKTMITGDLEVNPRENFVKIFHKPFSFDEMEVFIDGFMKSD